MPATLYAVCGPNSLSLELTLTLRYTMCGLNDLSLALGILYIEGVAEGGSRDVPGGTKMLGSALRSWTALPRCTDFGDGGVLAGARSSLRRRYL